MYPFGIQYADKHLPPNDDFSSDEIALRVPVIFFTTPFRSIYVNMNGHVSFDSEVPGYQGDKVLPFGIKLIAPFLADVDTRAVGRVYYRETSEENLLSRAAADIQSHFFGQVLFRPRSLFIVTWDRVGYYNQQNDKVNTFQLVLVTDGISSFAFFHYMDDGIQWIQSQGKLSPTVTDVPAQAGFDAGSDFQGQSNSLPESGTSSSFVNESNVNIPGVWMFQTGNVAQSTGIRAPDLHTGKVTIHDIGVGQTCLEGARQCHFHATCQELESGFCCHCLPGFYGNGKQCLEPDVPQTLNGPVQGSLNGVSLNNLDMHTYIVTKDGRTYTAISRIPVSLGPAMETLSTIGGAIGWLFAVPTSSQAANGFSFTGGVFNRSATVNYQRGNRTIHTVKITQRFYGHDALNNIRMDSQIYGDLPDISEGAKITIDDYNDNYKRIEPGLVKSFSVRTYRVNDVAFRYTWDQTISFEECKAHLVPDTQTMKLTVSRNFVRHSNRDQVVRYAMTNRISVMSGADPCSVAMQTCHEHADCLPSDQSFRCVCRDGYQGNGMDCQDVDECAMAVSKCDNNAKCFNVFGSFQCQCKSGFQGDGYTCTKRAHLVSWDQMSSQGNLSIDYMKKQDSQLCGDLRCGENAVCVYNAQLGQNQCQCSLGFRGDGIRCITVQFSCNEADICGDNAECALDPSTNAYICQCIDDFSGDGYNCEPTKRSDCRYCSTDADCVYDIEQLFYHCRCRIGFTGDGTSCTAIDQCGQCDMNADCTFDRVANRFQCQCRQGFYGDGLQCVHYDCRQNNVCHSDARCQFDVNNNVFICMCKTGFSGDGLQCLAQGCDVVNDCDVNARCLLDPSRPEHYRCQCNPGFDGDGKVCLQQVTACNQVNNCDRNALCLYDPDAMSYRCQCNRGYQGDGYICHRIGVPDCRSERALCDRNAACMEGRDGVFMCVCNPYFRGDGRTCTVAEQEKGKLVYARGNKVFSVSASSNDSDIGHHIDFIPGQLAVAVTVDCFTSQIYWTDAAAGTIHTAKQNGSDSQTIMTDLGSPEGIAVDTVSRNLYFTDSKLDIVAAARLDGSSRKTLFNTDMVNPRAIVVDITGGKIYWTDWNRNKPQIETAAMDGSGRRVLINSDLRLPNGLVFDHFTKQLCWADAGTRHIECVRSDGIGRRVVSTEPSHPFGLTLLNNILYWTDWNRNTISGVNMNEGGQISVIRPAVGGNGRLYGITAVQDQCSRGSNACSANNGGCMFLCLPTASGGRSCACPDGVDPRMCRQ